MSVRSSVEGNVGRIVLDRPEKLNAFTAAMLKELEAACERLEADEAVRVVLVVSASDKVVRVGSEQSTFGFSIH